MNQRAQELHLAVATSGPNPALKRASLDLLAPAVKGEHVGDGSLVTERRSNVSTTHLPPRASGLRHGCRLGSTDGACGSEHLQRTRLGARLYRRRNSGG